MVFHSDPDPRTAQSLEPGEPSRLSWLGGFPTSQQHLLHQPFPRAESWPPLLAFGIRILCTSPGQLQSKASRLLLVGGPLPVASLSRIKSNLDGGGTRSPPPATLVPGPKLFQILISFRSPRPTATNFGVEHTAPSFLSDREPPGSPPIGPASETHACFHVHPQ